MVPGTVNELSAHDRMILDLEKTEHTSVAREALCRHIELPLDKYTVVLEGIVDTDAAYSYAPDVVERVRQLRAERFAFERRHGRWKNPRS
ncbi:MULTISPECIES: DUF3263 domain-containing protein [Brevibacterium]|uniref:Uncharacterized protein n=1 Tax=Brevibacterium aurantiacum TaxID=273384 RepID=A0A3Q9NXI1_BREAU|nr:MULTISPECIES: DUF3263 domain-containing protein [Brevibacterium]AZL04408.1 hypothetical protein CXR24_01415 [Brevibacterium aurantiacum]AZT95804.1 hypothetical protein CXR27_01375 [Brevibacterium aurantiacum]WCE40378.1 DUF3263 domain-containing protein [Brevibacterium sp. BDJS002]